MSIEGCQVSRKKGSLKIFKVEIPLADVELLTVDELNGTLGLDGSHSSIDILGNDVSTVHEAASHVFSVPRIAFGHHTSGLKDGVGNLSHRELLVVGLLGRDDGCVRCKHEMDTRVWNHCEKKEILVSNANKKRVKRHHT